MRGRLAGGRGGRTMLPDRGPLKCDGTGRRSEWRILIVRGLLELERWRQGRVVVAGDIAIVTENVSVAADALCRCCVVVAAAGLQMHERRGIVTAVAVRAVVVRGQEGGDFVIAVVIETAVVVAPKGGTTVLSSLLLALARLLDS